MSRNVLLSAFGAIAGASLLLAGCTSADTDTAATDTGELREVQYVLGWTPSVNEAGIYVAEKLGYFAEEGLTVNVVPTPATANTSLVATGQAEFAQTQQEDVTQLREQDVPIVSIAAIIAHNTSGFASLPEAGITTPADFEGKTYGGWGSPIEDAIIRTLIEQDGGNPDNFTNVTLGATSVFANLASGAADFGWIYYATDAIPAQREGIDFNYIDLAENGLDWYTPVIVTSEQLIQDDPELVQSFINAASKGWQYAIEHPDETADIVLEYAPDLDAESTVAELEWLADQWQADSPYWGWQDETLWRDFSGWLEDAGIIGAGFDYSAAYTNTFVDAVSR